jgi:Tfp pilus assembly protein PilF
MAQSWQSVPRRGDSRLAIVSALAILVSSCGRQQQETPGRPPSNDALSAINGGMGQLEQGDFDGAVKSFGKAIELDPKNGEAFRLRGVAYS